MVVERLCHWNLRFDVFDIRWRRRVSRGSAAPPNVCAGSGVLRQTSCFRQLPIFLFARPYREIDHHDSSLRKQNLCMFLLRNEQRSAWFGTPRRCCCVQVIANASLTITFPNVTSNLVAYLQRNGHVFWKASRSFATLVFAFQ